MKRFSIGLFPILCFTLACCNNGYKKIDDQASFKVIQFENDSINISQGDMCYMLIETRSKEGYSIPLYPTQGYIFICDTTSKYWTRYLHGFSSGDSISFILDKNLFLTDHIKDIENISVNTRIVWVTQLDLETKEQLGSFEFANIFQYMMEHNVNPLENYYNSIYILENQNSEENLAYGDPVILHSKMYFLNDSLIFDSRKENTPLYFSIGQEDQVIPGVEIALSIMGYNNDCEIIIPSELSFGEKGSTEIGIPPNTPIRTILSVEKPLSTAQE